MRIRISSRINEIGRRFYVEKLFGYFFCKIWVNIGSFVGYETEEEAKRFAEDYAKGDWISDHAKF